MTYKGNTYYENEYSSSITIPTIVTYGILTIPSNPIIIQCTDSEITLIGLADGAEVAVSTIVGTLVAENTATNDTATLATDLNASTTIVKIGNIKAAIK